jgi:hypothetical protein
MRTVFGSFVFVGGTIAALAACSGSQPVSCGPGQYYDAASGTCLSGGCPPGTWWNGSMCAAGGGAGGMSAGAGGMSAGAGGMSTGAGGMSTGAGGMSTGAGGGVMTPGACVPATPLDPMAAQAATQGLTLLAQQNVEPGATPVGGALAGNFQPGQCLETQVMLSPGKCYTAVAAGLGPTEVDVQLVAPLPGALAQTIAQDQTTGPTAVLGPKPNCFRWAAPVAAPMKLVLKVSGGQGPAAVQLYEK